MTDDSAIVDLYLLRDESAIALTAEKYGRQLRRLAENILGDRFLAEECENDTYLQAWNSIPPHEPRSYLFSFLGMITRNLAIDACRKIKRRQQKAEFSELSEELEECLPGRENVEESVEAAFLRESINRFLDGCTEIQRDVFLRRYWYFDTIPKISRRYGFTQSKIKNDASADAGGAAKAPSERRISDMKGEDLLKIIGGVRPEYVEHASCSGRNVRKRWVLAGQIAALAAGLALVILIGLAVPKLFRGDPAESDPSAETAVTLPSSEESLADVTTMAVPSVSHSETAAESSDSHTANSGGIRDSYLCFNGMLYLASGRQLTSLPEGFSETAVILSVDTDHMPTGELSATRLEVGARLFSRGYTVHDTLYVQQKDGLYETFVCASPVGTLEQFAQIRPVVFYGTCVGEKDPYGYALFEIKEAYRGETGKELYVELWNDYPVEVGEEYICYGVLSANVFLDRIFCSVNELITPDGESVKTRYISDLEGRSFEDILQMLPDIIEQNPYAYSEYAKGEIAGDYIHSSDREEIEELSEYVAAVKAVSIQAWRNNLNYVAEDRQLVLFEVVDVIKGNLQTGEINMLVPAHRIEDGKTYQICFRYYGAWSSAEGEEEQSYYIISAPESIWPIEP